MRRSFGARTEALAREIIEGLGLDPDTEILEVAESRTADFCEVKLRRAGCGTGIFRNAPQELQRLHLETALNLILLKSQVL
jgi:hypothetical protein